MKTIQLQVKDEFLEEFLTLLPKDKVQILEQQFIDDKILLHKIFKDYINGEEKCTPLYENMESINQWLKTVEKP